MFPEETINVYRSRCSGQYRIQPFGKLANGSSQPFGDEVIVPPHAPAKTLLDAMLQAMKKNRSQMYDRNSAVRVTSEEWSKEVTEDQLITVQGQSAEVRLIPCRKMGNSFGSIDEMIRAVTKDEFSERGGEIIRLLFQEMP